MTELIDAILDKDLEEVRRLIDNGADVNARDNFYIRPLLYAANNGYLGVAKLLIESGADVNAKDNKGKTPMEIATDQENSDPFRSKIIGKILMIDRIPDRERIMNKMDISVPQKITFGNGTQGVLNTTRDCSTEEKPRRHEGAWIIQLFAKDGRIKLSTFCILKENTWLGYDLRMDEATSFMKNNSEEGDYITETLSLAYPNFKIHEEDDEEND